MKRRIICGLDIGTSKICAACGTMDGSGRLDILAVQTVPAEGVEAGRITDSKRLSAGIRQAMSRLNKASGLKLRRVYANIDSPDLRTKECEQELFFKKKTKIKKALLNRLIHSLLSSSVSLDRRVVHTGFRNFTFDNRFNCSYPKQGHSASRLKLELVVLSVLIPTIKALVKCLRDAGLIIMDLVPSGCAQALGFFRAVQPEAEEDNILIDIGAAQIKLSALKNGLLRAFLLLPLGSQGIREDIAMKLKVSLACAEQLQVRYGRILGQNELLNRKIIIKDGLANKIIPAQQLCEIITVKVDQLLAATKKDLLKIDYGSKKSSEIIITGGGSIMEGFLERAERLLGQPVKMGFLSAVKDNRIQTQSGLYATSIGLIHLGLKKKLQKKSFARAKFDPFIYILNRAKDLYREYF